MRRIRISRTVWALSALAAGLMGCGDENGLTQPVRQAHPTKLAFAVQPVGAIAGATVAPALRVAIQDASGATVTSATTAISVALGVNPGGGTLTGVTAVNPVDGIATFSELTIDKAASGYTLVASAAGLSGATSTPFSVQPASATKLAFAVQPTDAIAGAAIAPTVQVAIHDAFDNTVAGATAGVTVALGANPGGGILHGTTTVSTVDGVASFGAIWIDKAASGYTLVASAGALAGTTSATFAVAPAAKAKLDFLVQPIAPATAEPVTPALQVAIEDEFGNTVTSAMDAVTVAFGANPTNASLSGTRTVAAYNGVATFHDLRIDRPGIGYTLEASAAGVSGSTSIPFSVTLRFANVSAGLRHTCGTTVTGEAYCWGNNLYGQLGDGTTADAWIPVRVSGGLRFAVVRAGDYHTCGITDAGVTYCWGYNGYGQLGNGSSDGMATAPALVAGGVSFDSVSVGGDHTCGVTTTGVAYCWGDNSSGQLGDETTTRRSSPVLVAGGLTFAALSTGGSTFGNPSHTCGVTRSGVPYCWGHNFSGQLGDGTTTARFAPVLVTGGRSFTMVSAGGGHTCGVTAAGAAYCWGYNAARQLGDGTTTDQVAPALVMGNLHFAAVSAGYAHTCGVTAEDLVYCWGSNGSGERGDGSNNNPRSSPGLVAGGRQYATVSARGGFHTCALTPTGAAYCWGNNDHGQLGDGTTGNRFEPVRVLP